MKKRALNGLTVLISTAAFILTGCLDNKDYYEPPVDKVPSQLSFSTTQDVQLKFNYNSSGLIAPFEVYAQNPYKKNAAGYWELQEGIEPIAAGINVDGVSDIFRTLPAYVKELYLCSSNYFVPTLKYAKIENGTASFEELDINAPIVVEATSRTLKPGEEAIDKYLKQSTDVTRLRYGYGENYCFRPTPDRIEIFPESVKNSIINAFPNVLRVDDKYYTDASIYIHQEDVKDEGAEIWISVINSDGSYRNSLSYFCYDGPKENLTNLSGAEKENLKVISVFQYAKNNPEGLLAGEYVKLKYYNKKTGNYEESFPIGTTIGWVLTSNGFYTSGSGTDEQFYTYGADRKNWYYSVPEWNPELSNKNHTTIFTATGQAKDYICFGFEDCHNEDYTKNDNQFVGDADCNDVMFHIISDPVKAIVPPPYIPEEGTVETNETRKGILAFEDYWPKKFDYDLNDVVAKYKSVTTYVQKTEDGKPVGEVYVKYLTDKITFLHAGANLANTFSYKVNIPVGNVQKVTVDGNDYAPIADGNGFIIDLCPNVNSVIVPYVIGTTPRSYNIMITLKEGTLLQDKFNKDKQFAPYNPFIFSEAGREIHLPNYAPTTRVNNAYFGTEDDMSDSHTNRWYVAGADIQYPFALHLSGVFTYEVPEEHKSIETSYPRYTNWVQNGCGSVDADWYIK